MFPLAAPFEGEDEDAAAAAAAMSWGSSTTVLTVASASAVECACAVAVAAALTVVLGPSMVKEVREPPVLERDLEGTKIIINASYIVENISKVMCCKNIFSEIESGKKHYLKVSRA